MRAGGAKLADGVLDRFGDSGRAVGPEEFARDPEANIGDGYRGQGLGRARAAPSWSSQR